MKCWKFPRLSMLILTEFHDFPGLINLQKFAETVVPNSTTFPEDFPGSV